MRKAFTLIELLVVVSVIGILAGLILPKINDLINSGRESTCRNNLRNLHTAVINFANERSGGLPNAAWWWQEFPNSMKAYHHSWIESLATQSESADAGYPKKAVDPDFTKPEQVKRAIEFGCIFDYAGRDKKIYCCPSARKKWIDDYKVNVAATYVMNGALGCVAINEKNFYNGLGSFGGYALDASRVLLFAEIAKDNYEKNKDDNPELKPMKDSYAGEPFGKMFVLYPPGNDDRDTTFVFGAYHSGRDKKNTQEGLVIFLDGHIEKHPAVYGTTTSKTNVAWRLCRGLSAN